MQRCMGYLEGIFHELEESLRCDFIPALFGDGVVVSDRDREIFALPARDAGLSIENPDKASHAKYRDSVEFTRPIQDAILAGGGELNWEQLEV